MAKKGKYYVYQKITTVHKTDKTQNRKLKTKATKTPPNTWDYHMCAERVNISTYESRRVARKLQTDDEYISQQGKRTLDCSFDK